MLAGRPAAGRELLLGSVQARVAITLRAFPLARPGLPGVYCLPCKASSGYAPSPRRLSTADAGACTLPSVGSGKM